MGKVKMLAREKARKVMSLKEAYEEDASLYGYNDVETENTYEEAATFNYAENVEKVSEDVNNLEEVTYVEEDVSTECYEACQLQMEEICEACSEVEETVYEAEDEEVTNDVVYNLSEDVTTTSNDEIVNEVEEATYTEVVEASYVEEVKEEIVDVDDALDEEITCTEVVEASCVEEVKEEIVDVDDTLNEEIICTEVVEASCVEEVKEEVVDNSQGCSTDGNCSSCERIDCVFSKAFSNKETKVESSKNKELIYEYAYCGGVDFFNKQINQIAAMAEKEEWSNRKDGAKNVLKKYIVKTFERCYKTGIISVSSDGNWSCFNTGLITTGGQDIIGVFSKNTKLDQQEWYLEGFKTETDGIFLDNFTQIPTVATYCNNDDYNFDVEKDIVLNVETVLEENFDKYSKEVKVLGKEVLKLVVMSSFEAAKKKVKRNARLVVPQFNDDKFGYLMPITIPVSDSKNVTMALCIERMASGNYIVNNMITIDVAYSRARQIMKPEATWLIKE